MAPLALETEPAAMYVIFAMAAYAAAGRVDLSLGLAPVACTAVEPEMGSIKVEVCLGIVIEVP